MSKTVTLKAGQWATDLTFKIRLSGPLRFRLWLALLAARLTAWLAGAKVDIEREPVAPGFVRLRGEGHPCLVSDDLKFEVRQRDGVWIPLRGVCEWSMKIAPNEVVTAMVLLELGELDLGTVPTSATQAEQGA